MVNRYDATLPDKADYSDRELGGHAEKAATLAPTLRLRGTPGLLDTGFAASVHSRRWSLNVDVMRSSMTWWIILYLVLYAVLTVEGLRDDYPDHGPAWFIGSALANVTIIFLFVAFWHPALRIPLGLVAPAAFVAAMCWEVFALIQDVRELAAAPELSERENRVIAAISFITVLIICVPAYVVAGITAFRV